MPDKKKLGTNNLIKLLKSVTNSPDDYIKDNELLLALKSQSGLAGYENKQIKKEKVSLNTLKNRADAYIDGGFKVLDNYRTSAFQSMQYKKDKSGESNRRTRVGLSKRVNELEEEVLEMQKICFCLIQGVTEATDEIEALVTQDNRSVRERRAKQAVTKLKSLLTINPEPFNSPVRNDNIVEIGKRAHKQ